MKVSFGIINYNRLFYLKSCAETLMKSVEDYEGEVEFICIDDNSKEKDTKEYLKTLSDRGWKVINQQDYRPSNKKDIGIIQYLNPTLQFLVAVFIFKEPFGIWQAIAFGLIWLALFLYTLATVSD